MVLMPRPSYVTPEMIADYHGRLTESAHSSTIDPDLLNDVGYALCWLKDELMAVAQLSDVQITNLGNAAGQIMYGRDAWMVAKKVLEDSRRGVLYQPGIKLADACCNGRMDERFGPGVDMTRAGIGKMLAAHNVRTVAELAEVLMKEHGCSSLDELRAVLKHKTNEASQNIEEEEL